eukprot:jgi/Botrbrau1/21177/Bobra.0061s0069.2
MTSPHAFLRQDTCPHAAARRRGHVATLTLTVFALLLASSVISLANQAWSWPLRSLTLSRTGTIRLRRMQEAAGGETLVTVSTSNSLVSESAPGEPALPFFRARISASLPVLLHDSATPAGLAGGPMTPQPDAAEVALPSDIPSSGVPMGSQRLFRGGGLPLPGPWDPPAGLNPSTLPVTPDLRAASLQAATAHDAVLGQGPLVGHAGTEGSDPMSRERADDGPGERDAGWAGHGGQDAEVGGLEGPGEQEKDAVKGDDGAWLATTDNEEVTMVLAWSEEGGWPRDRGTLAGRETAKADAVLLEQLYATVTEVARAHSALATLATSDGL